MFASWGLELEGFPVGSGRRKVEEEQRTLLLPVCEVTAGGPRVEGPRRRGGRHAAHVTACVCV